MPKLRSDSNWRHLSETQMDLLQSWLFEEKLSYKEVLERVEKQFSIKSNATSLGRLYHRLALERKVDDFKEILAWAPTGNHEDVSAVEQRVDAAIRKVLAINAYQMAIAPPHQLNTKELRRVMKIIAESRRQRTREGRLTLDELRLRTYGAMDFGNYMCKMRDEESKNAPLMPEIVRAFKQGSFEDFLDSFLGSQERENENNSDVPTTPKSPPSKPEDQSPSASPPK